MERSYRADHSMFRLVYKYKPTYSRLEVLGADIYVLPFPYSTCKRFDHWLRKADGTSTVDTLLIIRGKNRDMGQAQGKATTSFDHKQALIHPGADLTD